MIRSPFVQPEHVTKVEFEEFVDEMDEFRDDFDDFQDVVKNHFTGVDNRLDTIDGRLDAIEVELANKPNKAFFESYFKELKVVLKSR